MIKCAAMNMKETVFRFAMAVVLAAMLVVPAAGLDDVTSISAASYKPAAAPDSIVAAFGANLATSTLSTTSTTLPETLGGTSVTVKDSAGVVRTAGLYFVSPGQVNYLVPAGTASGPAVVTVTDGQGSARQGALLVHNAAPGLFAANADGKGAAAATALGAAPAGTQTPIPVIRLDANFSRYLTTPIDLGIATARVVLSLFGTGFLHATTVTVTIGSQQVPVVQKGPQGQYPGLDRVDVELPRSLASRGTAIAVLTADGIESNPVTVEVLHYQYLNFGFETVKADGAAWSWNFSGSGYEFAVDDSVARSGSRSLRVRNLSAVAPSVGDAWQGFPMAGGLERARGKHIRLSAYSKTAGISRGWAGLWLRVDGPSGVISTDNAAAQSPTADWQLCVIDRDVSADVSDIYYGALLTGDGTAWFDDLQLEIDGVVYRQQPPMTGTPATGQVDWVRNAANPITTPNAGSGFDDLAAFKKIVGDAHIVALGEVTHGVSEFFRMKHRLLEYLATEMGFTVFAIEANMPEAYRLNDYVLNGIGDPRALLKGMYFWTWNTQEVLDMILWMREFNASGRGRLQFTGFDMQYLSVAMDNVWAFVQRADPAYLGVVNGAYAAAQQVNTSYLNGGSVDRSTVIAAADAARAVWQYLQQHRSEYAGVFSVEQIDWAIQNGRIVEQATYNATRELDYRDRCMAENFEWILQHNPPGTRAVIWAHNGHISRTAYGPAAMGWYVAGLHDNDYLPVMQLFGEGGYNAISQEGLGVNQAVPAYPGTLEYVLHSTGMSSFLLDMRKVAADDPNAAWMLGDMEFRDIGAVASVDFSQTGTLLWDWDVIVYFDRVTPSVLLPF